MKNKLFLIIGLILSVSILSFGCASKKAGEGESTEKTWEEQERERLAREQELRERLGAAAVELETRIHFDFDRYDLKPDAREILSNKARVMQQYPQIRLVIEGHCDQRGTAEYNLALGERRARAAQDYLVSLGVGMDRLSIVSYGKERPLDPGSGEAAWALNRRDEFRPSY